MGTSAAAGWGDSDGDVQRLVIAGAGMCGQGPQEFVNSAIRDRFDRALRGEINGAEQSPRRIKVERIPGPGPALESPDEEAPHPDQDGSAAGSSTTSRVSPVPLAERVKNATAQRAAGGGDGVQGGAWAEADGPGRRESSRSAGMVPVKPESGTEEAKPESKRKAQRPRAVARNGRPDPVLPPPGCMNTLTPDAEFWGAILTLFRGEDPDTVITLRELRQLLEYVGTQGAAERGGPALYRRIVPYVRIARNQKEAVMSYGSLVSGAKQKLSEL